MINKEKKLFTIPLVNKWYVVLTLIFILMRITHIIDWSPLWILSPLWLPFVLCIIILGCPYIILGIGWVILTIWEFLEKYYRKLKIKWKR